MFFRTRDSPRNNFPLNGYEMKIFKVKISYKLIKDNLSVIVIIPTLMGGFWQMFELVTIDTSYLRFFSISQIIPDGLLILFWLSMLYLGFWLVLKDNRSSNTALQTGATNSVETTTFSTTQNANISIIPQENVVGNTAKRLFLRRSAAVAQPKTKLSGYLFILFVIALFSTIFYWGFLPEVLIPFLNAYTLPMPVWAYMFAGFGLLYMMMKIITRKLLDIHQVDINFEHKTFGNFVQWVSVIVFALGIFFVIRSIRLFHRSFFMPDNLKNKELLLLKVKEQSPSDSMVEVRYFNDKFIFLKHYKKGGANSIEVIPFEALMQNSSDSAKAR